jgi:hypothetical protein
MSSMKLLAVKVAFLRFALLNQTLLPPCTELPAI